MMVKFFLTYFFLFTPLAFYAQNRRILLFEDYVDGVVLMKNGGKISTKLNYDAANNTAMFKQGGEEMILTNLHQVDTIYMQKRKFVPTKGVCLEYVYTKKGSLYVFWDLKNAYKGKKGAYGAITQAKVETINTAEFNYGAYENQFVEIYQLSNRNKYFLGKNDGVVQIKGVKGLLKMFPQYQDSIKKYISEQKIDFSKANDAIKLLEYSLGLK